LTVTIYYNIIFFMDTILKPTDDIPTGFPVLLRFARKTYSWAIRDALKSEGYDDMPSNGVYVLMGIQKYGLSMSNLIKQLGLTKQSASQLVEVLVSRGYVNREAAKEDRRQIDISPTEKGKSVVNLVIVVIKQINKELYDEVGEENAQVAKYVLAVLIDINDRHYGLPRGLR
jgi:DNA-binding MarR family transcriptional regulator